MGYNTDIEGFAMQVRHAGCRFQGARVKIIGAGGAARAIAYSAFKHGARIITIYNRTISKAEDITHMLSVATREETTHCQLYAKVLSDFDAGFCDILVNATSVGLVKGHEEEMPI